MRSREILLSDIEEMLYQSKREEEKDQFDMRTQDWKYALRGRNEKGDKDLRIIIAFDDPRAIVITAIDKNQ